MPLCLVTIGTLSLALYIEEYLIEDVLYKVLVLQELYDCVICFHLIVEAKDISDGHEHRFKCLSLIGILCTIDKAVMSPQN